MHDFLLQSHPKLSAWSHNERCKEADSRTSSKMRTAEGAYKTALDRLHAVAQGQGQRRATCRCTQNSELFTVNIKDFQRILRPLQQGTLQAKMDFLKQVPLPCQACCSSQLIMQTFTHCLMASLSFSKCSNAGKVWALRTSLPVTCSLYPSGLKYVLVAL